MVGVCGTSNVEICFESSLKTPRDVVASVGETAMKPQRKETEDEEEERVRARSRL